jgi:hypothetical protein
MRKAGRFVASKLVILAVLACPVAKLCGSNGEQKAPDAGVIVVDGKEKRDQAVNVPVVIRVRCATRQVNLAVTVESGSLASFSELPPGEYEIEVTAGAYQAAKLVVAAGAGQTVSVSAGVTHDEPPSISLRLNPAAADESPAPLNAALLLRNENNAGAAKPTETANLTETAKHAEGFTCPFDEVVHGASRRLEEFVQNVNRVSAIEVLEHERLNKRGKVVEREKHTFNYVAIIELTGPGQLNVDEYRDGLLGANGGFPYDMATVGMPSLAMVFHPVHLTEFEMACEGVGAWRERRVWRVRFQQRKDQPARMSDFRIGTKLFPVLLKGVAWIDAENYQIVHLETDLIEAMPEVKLYSEHQALEYGPVQFADRKTTMWLPQEAEIDLESAGRHFHHRHLYSKYRIFSVAVGQKIGDPK